MVNENRIQIGELNDEERSQLTCFEINQSYRVPAKTPHWIVADGENLVGIIIGLNSKSCTRVYGCASIYKPVSQVEALCYTDMSLEMDLDNSHLKEFKDPRNK